MDCPSVTLAGAVRVVLVAINGTVAEDTVTTTAADVELPKALSPWKAAVIVWVPTLSVVTFNVATPPLRVPVPSVVPPSEKTTLPLAVPLAAATVAVSATVCPTVIEVGLAVRLVVVDVGWGVVTPPLVDHRYTVIE
jgi:hypothetical protein